MSSHETFGFSSVVGNFVGWNGDRAQRNARVHEGHGAQDPDGLKSWELRSFASIVGNLTW